MTKTKGLLVRLTPKQRARVQAQAERWLEGKESYRTKNDYFVMKILQEEQKQERDTPVTT